MLPPRAMLAALFASAASLSSAALGADGPTAAATTGPDVRVRAWAFVNAQAQPRGDETEIHGTVLDDLGHPLGNVGLRLEFEHAVEPAGEQAVPVPCPPTSGVTVAESRPPPRASSYRIETSSAGQFCVKLSDKRAQGALHITLDDTRGLYEAPERTVAVDRSKAALTLRFFPEPPALELENVSHTLFIETHLGPETNPEPIELVLRMDATDAHRVLDQRTVTPGERVQFDATTAALANPGPAMLTVSFAGSDKLLPVEQSAKVLRTARVELAVESDAPPLDPENGSSVVVHARSVAQAVPPGAVEALLGRETLGIAPLVAGEARVPLRAFATSADHAAVTFRYVPVDPWWVPGSALEISVAIAPPSAWRQIPWLLGVAGLGLWLFAAWRRPGRTEKPKRSAEADAASGRPSVEIVEPGAQGSGWRGIVYDAHDQAPIANAHVAIHVPSISGVGLIASALTDDAGRFELSPRPQAHGEGTRFVVSARWHATLERSMPAEGTLAIQLVTRRRALLDRLVEWATRQGRPWAAAGQPTPGHVARVAQRRQSGEIAGWAEAVERAAYGPEPVEATREDSIRRREPLATPRRPEDRT